MPEIKVILKLWVCPPLFCKETTPSIFKTHNITFVQGFRYKIYQ